MAATGARAVPWYKYYLLGSGRLRISKLGMPKPQAKKYITKQKIKGELELLPLNLVKKDIESRSVCASRRL
jgi:hypothetical protein